MGTNYPNSSSRRLYCKNVGLYNLYLFLVYIAIVIDKDI